MIFCDNDSEFGDLCSKEAQHFYRVRFEPNGTDMYKARCEEHNSPIALTDKRTSPLWLGSHEAISENEYVVAQVMET